MQAIEINNVPWYRQLTKYHWFVFVVAALGWLFDTMDQQLFVLSRVDAMRDLLPKDTTPLQLNNATTLVTSIFLIGWATGGYFSVCLAIVLGASKPCFTQFCCIASLRPEYLRSRILGFCCIPILNWTWRRW